jgi:membrane associated rhomboid family serine protease
LLIIPYHVDVPMRRWPIGNFLLIVATILVTFAAGPRVRDLVLRDLSFPGLVGHLFVHAGLVHLLGNMLFLWVFGNAVCAKVGNLVYLPLYLLLGMLAAAAHLLIDGRPAVGASGAINGIVGFFLVLYPVNDIRCGWTFWFRFGTFTCSSGWMILAWLALDLLGAATGGHRIAYWAHIGGLAAGATLAAAALKLQWLQMEDTERSLLEVVSDFRRLIA